MIFAIIGPSGAGKNTICDPVFKAYNIGRPITTTTRKMRDGESQGNPHYFVDKINEEEFNNSPVSDKNHRNAAYWTTIQEFQKAKHVYRDLSRKGIEDAIQYFGKQNVCVIFIYVNPADIRKRLVKRDGRKSAFDRMAQNWDDKSFDDIDIADYCIINKSLENSQIQLRNIIKIELPDKKGDNYGTQELYTGYECFNQ